MKIGDEVTFIPNNANERTITGFIQEEITATGGGIGYHLWAPTVIEGDRQYVARVWLNRGAITPTGRTIDQIYHPSKTQSAQPPAKSEQKTASSTLPYRAAGDLAALYKSHGMSKQLAWDAFVRDTILLPRFRSDSLDARDFFRYFEKLV
jgi:hypothetical protein